MGTRRARAEIERTFSFDVAEPEGDGLTLRGYAAVFNQPTRIDNPAEGRFDEQIARGAFAKSINDGRKPVLMWAHGKDPAVGMVPIGKIESLREDDHGLFVEARLHDNAHTQPVRDAIASGAVTGMSFRFQPVRDRETYDGEVPLITRTEVALKELGPVPIPYYEGTSVSVRDMVVITDDDDDDDDPDDLVACLSCGTIGDRDDNFCSNCGTPMPGAAADTSTSSDAAPRGAPLDDAGAIQRARSLIAIGRELCEVQT